ncbi:hypothetical protein [Halomonas sp. HL-93]|uniref:hypothetical protein n=1 Tax=Halomonas sp. HL-93 TaxID=1666906 RepID=UPI0007F10A5D|nr:hypothetical protein [Halomonas sp. HL-93]SBR49150.1 hypothetical protein GA0071314_2066 [Halomonas sp. HL-93]
MALVTCKECLSEISSKAALCPQCGVPQTNKNQGKKALTMVFLAILAFYFMNDSDKDNDANSHAEIASKNSGRDIEHFKEPFNRNSADDRDNILPSSLGARAACRHFLIQYLNDPDNAEWEPGYTWETELEKDFAVVFPSLRTRNAKGLSILASFKCEIGFENGNWHLNELERI